MDGRSRCHLRQRIRRFVQRGGWWVVGQALVFGVFALGVVTSRPTAAAPWLWIAAGLLILVLGVWMAADSAIRLGPSLTPYPEPVAAAHLVDSGSYALVRHPIYGGVVLIALGIVLVTQRLTAVWAVVVLAAFFAVKSGFEEKRLQSIPGYAEYRARVRRRLIPWVL